MVKIKILDTIYLFFITFIDILKDLFLLLILPFTVIIAILLVAGQTSKEKLIYKKYDNQT